MTFGSIGAGHMGSAILRAVLDAGLYTPDRIHISSPVYLELEPFSAWGCKTGADNFQTVINADLVMLAVRPNLALDILREIAPLMGNKCLLSVCAGVSVASMKAILPENAFVIRAMPNLPLAYGFGATVMAEPEGVPERFVKAVRGIFEHGGIIEVMEEDKINAATALGGSAIAFFLRIAGVMSDWASENGISKDAALHFTAQTMLGTSAMMTRSGKTPKELANGVAVPGGMTEAAFRAFDREGFNEALRAGMDACRDKGIELVRLS
jgi:pyrroline-5-carboxylate reductase